MRMVLFAFAGAVTAAEVHDYVNNTYGAELRACVFSARPFLSYRPCLLAIQSRLALRTFSPSHPSSFLLIVPIWTNYNDVIEQ